MPYISIKMVVMPISLFFSNGLLLVLACNHPRPGRGSVVALIFRKRYGALRAATRRGSAENGRGAHHISGEVSEVFFFQHPPCMDSWHVLQEHGVHVVALL